MANGKDPSTLLTALLGERAIGMTQDEIVDELTSLRKRIDREQDRTTVIADVISGVVKGLPPVTPFKRLASPKAEMPHVAMLDISDVHWGEFVDVAITGGLNAYSYEIALQRGEELRRGVVRLVDMQRKVYPVDQLYVNMFGDMVTGEDIYPGQSFQIDRALTEQIFLGADWFANFLRDMAARFDEVHVRAVPGNHGRGYRKGQNHPRTNWDTLLYRMLALRLETIKNIDIQITDSSWLLYHIPGHEDYRHILIHGDEARSWMTIPWYGFERAGQRLESMLGAVLDYVHAGHHHNEARWANNRMEFLINGSWVGGSALSVQKMLRVSRPVQNLFFCHPRRGVVSHYPIQLAALPELSHDDRGVWGYVPVEPKEGE